MIETIKYHNPNKIGHAFPALIKQAHVYIITKEERNVCFLYLFIYFVPCFLLHSHLINVFCIFKKCNMVSIFQTFL